MYKATFIVLICLLISSCSAKQVALTPETSLRLVSDSIKVKVTGQQIDPKILDKLTRELKGQLYIAGFEVDKNDGKEINLTVVVTEFDPGNTALRLTISFGAGRGSLLYQAQYTSQTGQILAKMDGQERFTGLEPDFNAHYGAFANLGGEEMATEVLIKEAAKHITELALKK